MAKRLVVRLDGETRAQLEEIAAYRGESMSAVMRSLIDRAYEKKMQERSEHAHERVAQGTPQ